MKFNLSFYYKGGGGLAPHYQYRRVLRGVSGGVPREGFFLISYFITFMNNYWELGKNLCILERKKKFRFFFFSGLSDPNLGSSDPGRSGPRSDDLGLGSNDPIRIAIYRPESDRAIRSRIVRVLKPCFTMYIPFCFLSTFLIFSIYSFSR